jgi:hypothetical protein
MMPKEIGPWDGIQMWIHLAWNEGSHGQITRECSILSAAMIDWTDHEVQKLTSCIVEHQITKELAKLQFE